jgi:hypothetical protein
MRCPQVPPVTVAPPNRQRVHHDADCGVRAVGAARLVPSVVVALRMTTWVRTRAFVSKSRRCWDLRDGESIKDGLAGRQGLSIGTRNSLGSATRPAEVFIGTVV